MVLLLAIEGNIGIGKSTLLANLKAHFAGDKRVAFVDEARQTEHETVASAPALTVTV
jgi:deoxyadenosine/deoxycytidine kinase